MDRFCHEILTESTTIRISNSSRNGQTLFKNLAVNAAQILKCV